MLSSLRIRIRLYAGFLVVLALLALVAAASIWVFASVSTSFDRFAGAARGAGVGVELDRTAAMFDRRAAEYLSKPAAEARDALTASREALSRTIDEARSLNLAGEIRDQVETIATAYESYVAALGPAMTLAERRVEMAEGQLEPTAAKLVAEARDVLEKGTARQMASAARLIQHTLQAQMAVTAYLLEPTDDTFALIWEELSPSMRPSPRCPTPMRPLPSMTSTLTGSTSCRESSAKFRLPTKHCGPRARPLPKARRP